MTDHLACGDDDAPSHDGGVIAFFRVTGHACPSGVMDFAVDFQANHVVWPGEIQPPAAGGVKSIFPDRGREADSPD